ncbi:MAG: winged helix-turn-helix transcriptional regulator [Oscillospiraceae bacterium]|nr:winged helix-turn-helix transcriptional regulator [Oscillospiraceae bacterium]
MQTEREEMCFEFMALGNTLRRHYENSSGIRYVDKYTGSNQWILAYLLKNQGHDVFQKDIEETFLVRSSTVSKALKLMEKKELIKRESVQYDARLKKLVLTPKAYELSEIIEDDMKEILQKLTGGLTEEQISQFSEILKTIRKNFD